MWAHRVYVYPVRTFPTAPTVMTRLPRVLLLQARRPDDAALAHERLCFAERTALPTAAFMTVNMAVDDVEAALLEAVDVVFVGGAGHFSLAERNFEWFGDMMRLLESIIDRRIPMFASCFGFQALGLLFGGEVETVEEHAEVGTFPIELTEHGRQDPLFADLPPSFDVQLGHKDTVLTLPDRLQLLAGSERCPHQAFRVRGLPVVASQFHPELSYERNVERYVNYALEYNGIDDPAEAEAKARRELRPSPHPNGLLRRFLEGHVGYHPVEPADQ